MWMKLFRVGPKKPVAVESQSVFSGEGRSSFPIMCWAKRSRQSCIHIDTALTAVTSPGLENLLTRGVAWKRCSATPAGCSGSAALQLIREAEKDELTSVWL